VDNEDERSYIAGGIRMKAAYPMIMRKGEKHIVVFVPDFNINTQGADYADAMEMARDAIGLMGVDMEDEKEEIPGASNVSAIPKEHESDIITLVDIDFAEYRRKNDLRTVRRNVSLPSWLNAEADRAGLNVSAVLQTALKQELRISER
jgi:predicted RNase H-like HicB family nuclease